MACTMPCDRCGVGCAYKGRDGAAPEAMGAMWASPQHDRQVVTPMIEPMPVLV
jgi:hypothetical protein